MKKVDFAKLSEQYASFLVAMGGVTITVLTLVLTLGAETAELENISWDKPARLVYWRTFLAAALMVATACCFIGAHMMAETAAYFTYEKENSSDRLLGERLFLLASTNIFIGVVLLLFALMLLPSASARVDADAIAPISFPVFVAISVSALLWMCLAVDRRMDMLRGPYVFMRILGCMILTGVVWGGVFIRYLIPRYGLLHVTLIPIAALPVVSLLYSAIIFETDGKARAPKGNLFEICFFGEAVTVSYTSLLIAGYIMLWK